MDIIKLLLVEDDEDLAFMLKGGRIDGVKNKNVYEFGRYCFNVQLKYLSK